MQPITKGKIMFYNYSAQKLCHMDIIQNSLMGVFLWNTLSDLIKGLATSASFVAIN